MFGREEEFCTLNQQLLHELTSTTMQMCAQYNTNNQLSEKADVLEGFFSMLAALAKKVPQLIMTCGIDIAALFQCGKSFINTLNLQFKGMTTLHQILRNVHNQLLVFSRLQYRSYGALYTEI